MADRKGNDPQAEDAAKDVSEWRCVFAESSAETFYGYTKDGRKICKDTTYGDSYVYTFLCTTPLTELEHIKLCHSIAEIGRPEFFGRIHNVREFERYYRDIQEDRLNLLATIAALRAN